MVLYAGIFFIPLFTPVIFAQDECNVLLSRIGVLYKGTCKKGLADGYGEAIGADHYIGEFKKGYPEGTGTYTWQTGEKYTGEWKKGLRDGEGEYTFKYMDKDTVIFGEWKEDKYIGIKIPDPYIIEYRNGIGRVSCIRVGDRPYVKYVFSRGGVGNLMLQGSSGTENIITSFTGYEQVNFPFKGTVKFSAPNSWMTSMIYCELRLTINQPGAWVVTISF